MRNIYKYKIKSTDDLINKLLSKSKNIECLSILLSNNKKKNKLPKEYINYDMIVGIDSLYKLSCNLNSFDELTRFHNTYSDWMFGYLSYDLKNEIEDLSSDNYDGIELNQLTFFIPRHVFLLLKNELQVLSFESKEKVDLFLASLNNIHFSNTQSVILKPREEKEKYISKIAKIKQHIQRGDIYEMNYCMEYFSEDILLDFEELFFNLNQFNSNPFAAFLHLDHHYVACASPERFIKKIKNNIICQPIKGTIRRGNDFAEDIKLFKRLKNSQKDIAENIMITDLIRNDLSITALKSSVSVEELCEVYAFNKVHQMISTITSKVAEKVHFVELLKSVFPMGSMTGAPKLRAMQLIDKYEHFKRGLFSGSIGYITPNGDFDFNVVIRSVIYNLKKRYLSVGVGGAITIQSEPEKEYEECLVKIKPIIEILK